MLYGYILAGSEKFWLTCEKYRIYFLSAAVVCIITLFYRNWWNDTLPKQHDNDLYIYGILSSIQIWFLILAIIGFAKKHLNYSNSFLKYTTQAVYPFYILHQTLIVAVGYYVVQLEVPIFLKLLMLIISTFTLIYLIYHYLIKPFILTRILYGLKPKQKK